MGSSKTPEKYPAKAEGTKSIVRSAGKVGTTTLNYFRKFRQIYRGKIRQISVKYTELIKLISDTIIASGDAVA